MYKLLIHVINNDMNKREEHMFKKLKGFYWVILSIGILFIFTSCFSSYEPISRTKIKVSYEYKLSIVERPADTSARYGEYIIIPSYEIGRFLYEDELIVSSFTVGQNFISFGIKNKSESSIRLIWDEAAYVNPAGQSSRIMQIGVNNSERNYPQPPAIIVRKGMITAVVIPVDNVFQSFFTSNWITLDLILSEFDDAEKAHNSAKGYIGKTIQLLLPLEVKGEVNDYIFVFEVVGYSIK